MTSQLDLNTNALYVLINIQSSAAQRTAAFTKGRLCLVLFVRHALLISNVSLSGSYPHFHLTPTNHHVALSMSRSHVFTTLVSHTAFESSHLYHLLHTTTIDRKCRAKALSAFSAGGHNVFDRINHFLGAPTKTHTRRPAKNAAARPIRITCAVFSVVPFTMRRFPDE